MRLSAAPALAMLFLASSTVVDAALVAFTQPGNSDTSYQAGTTTIVGWKWDNTGNIVDVNTGTGKLNLGKSNANNIVEVQGLVEVLNATVLASGKYTWSIPANLAASDQYSLIMEVKTESYYTGKFKIIAAAPGGTTNTTGDTGSKGGDATINKAASLLTIPAILVAAVGQFFL